MSSACVHISVPIRLVGNTNICPRRSAMAVQSLVLAAFRVAGATFSKDLKRTSLQLEFVLKHYSKWDNKQDT